MLKDQSELQNEYINAIFLLHEYQIYKQSLDKVIILYENWMFIYFFSIIYFSPKNIIKDFSEKSQVINIEAHSVLS